MFSSHIIFADIDDSSKKPLEERIKYLKKFQDICNAHKPKNLNEYSFYDVDNDSFMAGFSSQEGLIAWADVFNFIAKLNDDFVNANIKVSFGVNVAGLNYHVDWIDEEETVSFVKKHPDALVLSNEVFKQNGRVDRTKLAGDTLIIASRLLKLSKKLRRNGTDIVGCFSFYGYDYPRDISGHKLYSGKRIIDFPVNNEFNLLSKDVQDWLNERFVQAYAFDFKN